LSLFQNTVCFETVLVNKNLQASDAAVPVGNNPEVFSGRHPGDALRPYGRIF
jgi:hypothetical protein